MKTPRVVLIATFVLLLGRECVSQPIVWTGDGDGTSWSDAQNWVGQQVPGPTNNVFITNLAGGMVTISSDVTVWSILCSNALTISSGSLYVTNGASLVQGTLTVSNGGLFLASGGGTTLTSGGLVDIASANLRSVGGAIMSLPGMGQYNQTAGLSGDFTADGAGSVLALPGLTNVTGMGAGSYYPLTIYAFSGGEVKLGAVSSISNTIVQVGANGTGSKVDLSALREFHGYMNVGEGFSQLGASQGGTVLLGRLGTANAVDIFDDVSGAMNLNSVTNVTGSTLFVISNTVTLPNVADIDDASIYVSGGGMLSLPGVVGYDHTADSNPAFSVMGSGSVLNLTALTNVTGMSYGSYNPMMIQALAGGTVNLDGRVLSSNTSVQVEASGSGSEVDLSALRRFIGYMNEGDGFSQLRATLGGTVLVGQLGTVNTVDILDDGSGTMNLDAVTNLSGSTLSVTNDAVTFPNAVDIDNASFYVSAGATLALPNVVQYDHTSDFVTVFQASGSGSVLTLSGLTNVTGMNAGSYYPLMIQALAGGMIHLDGLITITNTIVQAAAGGSGSELDMPALRVFDGFINVGDGFSQLQASGGGAVFVGQLGTVNAVDISDVGIGTLNLSAVTNLSGTTLTVTNGAVTLTNLSDIDNSSLYVSDGSMLSLPGVVEYDHSADSFAVFQASGAGSALGLGALTNVVGTNEGSYNPLAIQAIAGGMVNLDRVVSSSNAIVQVDASGSGSEVDLSALRVFHGRVNEGEGYSQLQAGGGGTLLVGHLGIANEMDISEDAVSTLNLSAITNFSGSTLILTGGSVTLTNLLNIDGAGLFVSGGASLSLPGVRNYVDLGGGAVWEATNSDSVIALPALTNLSGSPSGPTLIEALAGGQVLLNNLHSVGSGSVDFLSDGASSAINLASMAVFVLQNGQGSLAAQDGGAILFGIQPFLLCNVAINIPGGNPVVPSMLAASDTLTLCATPWHSYRVEEWSAFQPGVPIVTLLVPLTNSFQAIAPAPPQNITFIVTDFIANPPFLQIGLTPDSQTQLILYGLTNATYQIQSSTNSQGPPSWRPASLAVMTNAFRIFPEAMPTTTVQLYRTEQQ